MGKMNDSENKMTFRYDGKEAEIIAKGMRKYNISKSECVRLAILRLEETGTPEMLQILCNMCSSVNKIAEKYDLESADREYLNKEMEKVWQRLN